MSGLKEPFKSLCLFKPGSCAELHDKFPELVEAVAKTATNLGEVLDAHAPRRGPGGKGRGRFDDAASVSSGGVPAAKRFKPGGGFPARKGKPDPEGRDPNVYAAKGQQFGGVLMRIVDNRMAEGKCGRCGKAGHMVKQCKSPPVGDKGKPWHEYNPPSGGAGGGAGTSGRN